ncbi:MAG: sulfite exporter TauE/SafE family protein [Campylobacteraceae bacterium]
MEVELYSYFIVCPLIFFAGFVNAIAGGGGLIALPAYLIAGIPMHFALGTNKLSSTLGSIVSVFRYYKNGFIDFKLAIPSIFCALIGSFVGANIVIEISESFMNKFLLATLPLVAIYIFKKKSFTQTTTDISKQKALIYSALVSFFIGIYDGFFGPGTGTFLVIAYISIAKIDPKIATGNSRLVNLTSSFSALVVFLYNGYVLLPLGICACIFSMLGSYVGAGLVIKKGVTIIRYAIIFVLILLFIKILMN